MLFFQVSALRFPRPSGRPVGWADRVDQIVSVVDLMEFDEGRIE